MIRSTTDEMLAARHDPEPYVGADGRRYASPFDMAVGVFAPRVECIPSRAYTRPEPNPILVAFRDDPHLTTPERARDYLLYLVQHREHVKRAYTPAQIEDARKVLTRLVEVFS